MAMPEQRLMASHRASSYSSNMHTCSNSVYNEGYIEGTSVSLVESGEKMAWRPPS